MANECIGEVKCCFCGNACQVKRNVKKKLYYVCSATGKVQGCGIVQPNLPGFQVWMEKHVQLNQAPAQEPGQEQPAQGKPDQGKQEKTESDSGVFF